jgi:hypothetical protein
MKKVGKKAMSSSRPQSKGGAVKRIRKPAEPFVSKYSPIDYDKIKEIPELPLTIRLDQGLSNFVFETKVPINMTLKKVMDIINEKHGGACHNIRIFLVEKNSNKKYMDVFTYYTFKELGIQPTENLTLYYEYEPAVHPLLEAGLV